MNVMRSALLLTLLVLTVGITILIVSAQISVETGLMERVVVLEERNQTRDATFILQTCGALFQTFEIDLLRYEVFDPTLVVLFNELCDMELPAAPVGGYM